MVCHTPDLVTLRQLPRIRAGSSSGGVHGEALIRRAELVAAPGGEPSETGPWFSHDTRRGREAQESALGAVCPSWHWSAARSAFGATAASGEPSANVTICHRTNSNTNPYVQITVDERCAQRARQEPQRPVHLDDDAEGQRPEVGRHHPRVRRLPGAEPHHRARGTRPASPARRSWTTVV